MKIGGLNRSIGAGNKVGCVLALDLKREDGDSFMDRSVYGHLCTNYGSKWQLDGRYFDGNDYIDCGNDKSLDVSDFTIETCFRTLRATISWLIDKHVPNKELCGLDISRTVAGRITGWIRDGAGNLIQPYFDGGYNDDCGHQADLTRIGATGYLFMDGQFRDAKTNTAVGSTINTANLWIGGLTDQAIERFLGLIDKAQVYSFADYAPRILERAIEARRG